MDEPEIKRGSVNFQMTPEIRAELNAFAERILRMVGVVYTGRGAIRPELNIFGGVGLRLEVVLNGAHWIGVKVAPESTPPEAT